MSGIVLAGYKIPGIECQCRTCRRNKIKELTIFTSSAFIVCSTCSNKRCPHASDHNLKCTNSNEPGQPGSVYY